MVFNKLRHSSIIDYENPNFDPNKPIDNTNKERLKYAPYSNKYFSIWLGLSLGTGFLKALSENKTQF